MKAVFKAISDAVKTVDAVRWIDFDLGQLDQEKPPVSFPAVLVSFNSAVYTEQAANAYLGVLSVEIIVAFRLRERTHSVASSSFQEEALSHLDTLEAVRSAIVGLQGDHYGPLVFEGFSNDRRADPRVWRLRYRCQHMPPKPDEVYVPLPGSPGVPGFCVHPDM